MHAKRAGVCGFIDCAWWFFNFVPCSRDAPVAVCGAEREQFCLRGIPADAMRAHDVQSCSSATSSTQLNWEAHVITVDPTAARAQHTARVLSASGIVVHLVKALPPASSSLIDKVRSHTLTSRNIFETIAQQKRAPDEYVLLFEDDVALHPHVEQHLVRGLLSCAAHLSLRAAGGPLPLFYAGGCWPKHVHNQTFWGAGFTPGGGSSRGEASAVRMTCRCAHAYAVRRGDAPLLWRLANEQPPRMLRGAPIPSFYMDVQLDSLSRERGGVYLLGADKHSPQDPRNRGLWLQDRLTFRSGIGQPKLLSFVTHSGWGNQLVGLAHAMYVARKTERKLVVPRIVRLGEIKDDGGCFAKPPHHVPPTAELLARYAPYSHRPLIDAILDTSVWPTQAVVPEDADAYSKSSRYMVPNMCSFETKPSLKLRIGELKLNAAPPWSESLWPLLRSHDAQTSAVVQLGSAFTLYSEWNCDFCFVRYRPELLLRATRLLCTSPLVACPADPRAPPKYDAIHLRLTPPYPRAYNVTAALRAALLPATPHASGASEPPLYVASDNMERALRLASELNVGIGRRLVSLADVDPSSAAAIFGEHRAKFDDALYGHLRPLLTDALIGVGSRRFTPSAGTFSGHIMGIRACAAAKRMPLWRPSSSVSRQMHDTPCPASLRRYDFANNCPSVDSCELPRVDRLWAQHDHASAPAAE